MFTMPDDFDENEWFIIIIILLSTILFKLPKRLPSEITILILLLSVAIPKIIDHTIATPWPYDLYDLNDSNAFEWFDLILDGIYLPFGYMCVYIYDKLMPKGIKFVLYIVVWTIFAIFFDYISVKFNVFTYHGWKLTYSIPTYIVVISIFLFFYEFVNYYYKKTIRT